MTYQELTDKINAADRFDSNSREVLDMEKQLLDVVVKDLFKLYPNLESFKWKQMRPHVSILVNEIVVNGKVQVIFGNGTYDYIGVSEKDDSMSQQDKAIAVDVTNKIHEISPDCLVELFGEEKTIRANRRGLFVE